MFYYKLCQRYAHLSSVRVHNVNPVVPRIRDILRQAAVFILHTDKSYCRLRYRYSR
jgi:hypothetical protein